MARVVYLLCALTSVTCMLLLFRHYWRTRVPLLFWSSAAFLALAIANVLLFVDLVVVPQFDFSTARQFITLVGVTLLIYGLIRTQN